MGPKHQKRISAELFSVNSSQVRLNRRRSNRPLDDREQDISLSKIGSAVSRPRLLTQGSPDCVKDGVPLAVERNNLCFAVECMQRCAQLMELDAVVFTRAAILSGVRLEPP